MFIWITCVQSSPERNLFYDLPYRSFPSRPQASWGLFFNISVLNKISKYTCTSRLIDLLNYFSLDGVSVLIIFHLFPCSKHRWEFFSLLLDWMNTKIHKNLSCYHNSTPAYSEIYLHYSKNVLFCKFFINIVGFILIYS